MLVASLQPRRAMNCVASFDHLVDNRELARTRFLWPLVMALRDHATGLGFVGGADQSHHSKRHCILRLKPEPHCLKGDSEPRVQHVEISNDHCNQRWRQATVEPRIVEA
jgi:hypothetical protein